MTVDEPQDGRDAGRSGCPPTSRTRCRRSCRTTTDEANSLPPVVPDDEPDEVNSLPPVVPDEPSPTT